MKDRNLNHSDSWSTPKYLYDQLNAEFNFDFDPCPLELGEITPEKDGLLKEWGGSNFINPPYSQKLKEAFVIKAINESKKENSAYYFYQYLHQQNYSMNIFYQTKKRLGF